MNTGEVVVVSGSYGAGHDAAADALAHQFRSAGHVVRRLDVAEELPWRIGALLRCLYFTQLRLMPGTWGTALRCFEGDGKAFRAAQWLLGLLGRRLVREVAGAELVVSTHPFASQALGEARALGTLDAPVVTYLTDASVHRLWVHPAVDLHLAIHQLAADQALQLGGKTTAVRPVVARSPGPIPEGWFAPWPLDRPAALVVGGSCGVGELYETAVDLLATGLVTPVVACGNNDRLRDHLNAVPGVVALGWRDDMAALVGAATCVIQNAGGMTSLESLAAGTPTLTYRPIPGHGTSNAEALHLAGLVPWLADEAELGSALARVLLSSESFALPSGAPELMDVLARQRLVLAETWLVAA
jgi:UDP-N-acetylglucosamine:LPS N-acetylglucosamine transferase